MSGEISVEKDEKQEAAQEAEATTQGQPTGGASTSEQTQQKEKESQTNAESEKPTRDDKYVPLGELIKERQRRREMEAELRAELSELKKTVSKVSERDPIRELMEDFNVDEETAKKLHKHGLGKKETAQAANEDALLQQKFIKAAEDISSDYSDWDELKEDMAALLGKECEKSSERLALMKGPEYYYLQAKLMRERKEKESSVKQAIQKANEKNLASSESGKNTSGRPSEKIKKGTLAWLRSLSPEEFEKNHEYINAELARGGFKE